MESNVDEALIAKVNAEKQFAVKDFVGAKNYALKAQTLVPGLDGIPEMVATFNVYIASEAKVNGEIDFYSVLGLNPSAGRSIIEVQYKKLAMLLHPNKNKTVGADGAFKLVSDAWTVLSDSVKRASYDIKRNGQLSSAAVTRATRSNNRIKASIRPTFWTICTSCHVQYEYLRKYVNKRLSCKNCHAIFMAVELEMAPLSGSYPVYPCSYMPDNGYGGHGYNGVTLFHGRGFEYGSNVSFQQSTCPSTSAGYLDPNGLITGSSSTIYQANGYLCKPRKKLKVISGVLNTVDVDINANGSIGCNESSGTKATRPYKRRVDWVDTLAGKEEDSKVVSEAEMANGNGSSSISPMFCSPVGPTFMARSFLIEKARTEIRRKLKEMKLASGACSKHGKPRKGNLGSSHSGLKKIGRATPVVLLEAAKDSQADASGSLN